MDWFGWLSRTGLDPDLTYQYGLEFTRNELHGEDLPYFDHEFLQSMGIYVAKHRLEIIKLARKDASRSDRRLSRLVDVIARTRRSVRKYIGRLISQDGVASTKDSKERSLALSGPLNGKLGQKYVQDDDVPRSPMSPNWFGLVDGKVQEKRIVASKGPWFSGPLDWQARSPRVSRSVERGASRSPGVVSGLRSSPRVHGEGRELGDGYDEHSLWAKLFHDMKPT
ncbi:hypothetical protein SAY86_007797 [Trapa natans]|uniref:SAM domain-containing protein n=1 Tax=Trapa natans TaxID=22666 RepID=A0AAN7R2I0_TRANT|nr:hypothetical protein SAY86_007797 [Trapa natans]